METHENIKLLRESQGLSQEALAEKVGYKDRSSIAKIESGVVDLSQSKIAAFAKALNVTPAQLMGISDEPSRSLSSNILHCRNLYRSLVIVLLLVDNLFLLWKKLKSLTQYRRISHVILPSVVKVTA